MIKCTYTLKAGALQIGQAFITTEDYNQRICLSAMADAVDKMGVGKWAMQCRYILDAFNPEIDDNMEENDILVLKMKSDIKRKKIISLLSVLIDHLEEDL